MSSSRSSRAHGGTTAVIELEPVHVSSQQQEPETSHKRTSSQWGKIPGRSSAEEYNTDEDRNETLPSPTTAGEREQEKWNSPRINMYRCFAAFWSFVVMGLNDASYGPIIPYLETYYGLSYTIVSLIFLSPFVGYVITALLNNTIHLRLGQRGVAFMGPSCHLIAYIIICLHPPYPLLVIAFMLSGFGNGLEDSAWNAWIGDMANANEVLGFLHGFYGIGATIAPLIATSMIAKASLPWYNWYYVMIATAILELTTCLWAFRAQTGAVFQATHPRTTNAQGNRMKEALLQQPAARVTWLSALFLLGYVGVEVALGGWIVTFMSRVRHGGDFASGMTATGFWLGVSLGRLVLGFATPRIGEKLAISIYLPLAAALELIFWLVPHFYVSAVAVALQGFFLGPMFPAAMVACTKLLPRHLHVGGIGFAAAFGGSGGALFPFVIGVLAQARGVQVLQPIVLGLLVVIWALWLGLPRIEKKRD